MRQARLGQVTVLSTGQHAGIDRNGPLLNTLGQFTQKTLRAKQRRSSPITHGRTHGAGQRPTDLPIIEHLIRCDGEPVLRIRIQSPHGVVFGRCIGDLLTRRAESLHVVRRLHGIGVHEQGPAATVGHKRFARLLAGLQVIRLPLVRIKLVNSTLKNFHGALRIAREKCFFDTHGQRQITLARKDVFVCTMKRHGGCRTAAFNVDEWHPFRKNAFAHQRGKTHLSTDIALPKGTHAAIAKPGLLNLMRDIGPRIREQPHECFSGEVFECFVSLLAKGRARNTNHINIAHEEPPEIKPV